MNRVILFVVLALLAGIYGQEPSDESNTLWFNTWDFIIVGAGEAGSVVASRLAEETSKRILLLEGGDKSTGQRDVGGTDYVASSFKTDPITGKQSLDVPFTRYDVPLMADSIRQASDVLNNTWPINAIGPLFGQAKVVGGNQATNGFNWIFPQKYDLDAFGIPEYNSANFWPYLKRTENATQAGFCPSPDRGCAGRTNIKRASFVQPEQYRFLNTCIAAGYSVGYDVNDGVLETGVYFNQNNIKSNGIRDSTSISYLAPVLKTKGPRLTFRTSAVVTQVLFNASNAAIGVEYYDEIAAVKRTAYARIEVIIAAGDLQVSKILFNSGIGPKSILQAYGKPLRVVNELVGQKIRNHQRATMQFTDPTILNANLYSYPAVSVQYARTGTGPLEGRGIQLLSFQSNYSKPPPYPDIQATFGLVAGSTPTSLYTQGFAITAFLAYNQYANGTVNLTSSDPLAATTFTVNAFVVQEDVERVAHAILEIRRLMKFWNGSAVEVSPGPDVATIPQLVTWIRANPGTTCHYYSSTPMGTSASNSVVDTRMRVRGVSKLRIVGPSVLPGKVYTGMQALTQALAEKGTDLIKADYSL